MTRVYVGIGSNVERERHVQAALQALRSTFGAVTVSPVYETEAVGFRGAPFHNLVAGFDTGWTVGELAAWLRALEDAHGRVRGEAKFSDRTLDVDLLVYGNVHGVVDGVSLPRAETTQQAFVLKPLADIAPELVLPGFTASCRVLWERHPDAGQAMRIAQA